MKRTALIFAACLFLGTIGHAQQTNVTLSVAQPVCWSGSPCSTSFPDATATGASQIFKDIGQSQHTLSYCLATGTLSGITIWLEGSFDGLTWFPISLSGTLGPGIENCGTTPTGTTSQSALQASGYWPNVRARIFLLTGTAPNIRAWYSGAASPVDSSFVVRTVQANGGGFSLSNNYANTNSFLNDGTNHPLFVPMVPFLLSPLSQLLDLQETATATSETQSINKGAALTEKGARWTITSNPAAGSQASTSKAAGGSGVNHIADCIGFSAGSTTAPALTALTINLRDGATGAGTIKWTFEIIITAAAGQNVPAQSFCGLNIAGSGNTAMTLEYSASLANLIESVSLSGYDVNDIN